MSRLDPAALLARKKAIWAWFEAIDACVEAQLMYFERMVVPLPDLPRLHPGLVPFEASFVPVFVGEYQQKGWQVTIDAGPTLVFSLKDAGGDLLALPPPPPPPPPTLAPAPPAKVGQPALPEQVVVMPRPADTANPQVPALPHTAVAPHEEREKPAPEGGEEEGEEVIPAVTLNVSTEAEEIDIPMGEEVPPPPPSLPPAAATADEAAAILHVLPVAQAKGQTGFTLHLPAAYEPSLSFRLTHQVPQPTTRRSR
jgi:hypothetical protein